MTTTVCLAAGALDYPRGGGHLWVYLNWALGLRALGCRVIWLEAVEPRTSARTLRTNVRALRARLEPYGLADSLALYSPTSQRLPRAETDGCLDLACATEADLLLSMQYDMPRETLLRFCRSAFLEIDPGELQIWLSKGVLHVAPHDVYFTIGETVGKPEARFPDAGLTWNYTPPCVALDWWPPQPAASGTPFTTVGHWYGGWMEDDDGGYEDSKRDAFLPYMDLPQLTTQSLELALDIVPNDQDLVLLKERGWRVRNSRAVASTPWDYQRYIQGSRGEFSCAKAHCVRLQNAWISDRTLCYLASGKPAVVEHTGPSRFLPEADGLFRFRTLAQAVDCLEAIAADYERHCCHARELAEEYFDARKVVGRVLERALP